MSLKVIKKVFLDNEDFYFFDIQNRFLQNGLDLFLNKIYQGYIYIKNGKFYFCSVISGDEIMFDYTENDIIIKTELKKFTTSNRRWKK